MVKINLHPKSNAINTKLKLVVVLILCAFAVYIGIDGLELLKIKFHPKSNKINKN